MTTNCKACDVVERGMIEMFNHPRLIDQMFWEVTGIQVIGNDFICLDCYEELRAAFKFKEKCFQSYKKYNDVDVQPVELIEELPAADGNEIDDTSSMINIEEIRFMSEEGLVESQEELLEVKDDKVQVENLLKEYETPVSEFANTQSFVCKFCKKIFDNKQSKEDHEEEHKKHIFPYQCSFENCDKTFKSRPNLLRHKMKHESGETLKCRFCAKVFQALSYLEAHERIHSPDKPFVCSMCPKSFSHSSNLKSHLKLHTGERKYKCNHCDKAFFTSHNLKVHERIHSGFKPYSCKTCGKTFNTFQKLKIHATTHQGTKIYKCNICNVSYYYGSGLHRHIKTVHSNVNEIPS